MEFRRVEVKRTIRHQERVADPLETSRIFEALRDNRLSFSMRYGHMGWLRSCNVIDMKEQAVRVFSRQPSKVYVWADFKDIENVEVESNCDFLVEEDDQGRWARII